MKCPFRKITTNTGTRCGSGAIGSDAYPYRSTEEFAECIGEECAAFLLNRTCNLIGGGTMKHDTETAK